MKFNCRLMMLVFLVAGMHSCNQPVHPDSPISKEEMMKIVKENDNKFSIGVKNKDASFIADIYSDSAQYVQPHRTILNGKDSILKDWENFIALKEKPIDLILNIHDVRGNREIIYETGEGFTLLADSSRWEINYVNVWRLQKDGGYRLEIDTYNDRK
jgi:ketosteroid isomerase-like protein